MRSARCLETGTPGAGSGPGNGPVDKTGTAPRADFTTHRSLNTHRSRKMRRYTEAHPDWLTVVHLPDDRRPDVNAVEGAWASMKSGLGNHTATTLDELETIVRSRLRSIQRRPDLINAFLGQTGLTLDPGHPRPQPFNLCRSATILS